MSDYHEMLYNSIESNNDVNAVIAITKLAERDLLCDETSTHVSPIIMTILHDRPDLLRVILKYGVDPNTTDHCGDNLLTISGQKGSHGCVEALLQAGADPNGTGEDMHTPLMQASRWGHTQCVKLLLDAKADVNAYTPTRYTSLMAACIVGSVECAKVLLDAGADPSFIHLHGKTSLDLAKQYYRSGCVELLEKHMSVVTRG